MLVRPIVDPLSRPLVGPLPSSGAGIDPAQEILAAYTGAGWSVPFLFLARIGDVTLVSGNVDTWVNRGTASNATQGTAAARPAFSESSFNSRPGLTFDGGDLLTTSAVDLAAFTAMVEHVVFVDSVAGVAIVSERSASAGANDGATYFTVNETAGTVRYLGHQTAGNSIVDSSAQTMAAGHVVTGTWDQALATNETEIRIDGANATASRVTNTNTTGGFGNHVMYIGARNAIALPLTGVIAARILAVGTTAIPLSAVAAVENVLKVNWGTP